ADRQDELDTMQPGEEFAMPAPRAFTARRQIAACIIETWKAEPHRHDRDLRFVIERLAVDTHPVAQAIAGRVVERYPGRMHTGIRCLAGYEQTCRRTSPDHRSRLMRQWPAQRLLHAYATGPDFRE